jgi:hypothetical protein
LYEQAHGLIRSKNWRQALSKMEEIQQLDSQFEDKDVVTEQAKAELAREEQEIQRQNELAAMYAESVRLMQEGKYQEAIDKWQEVRTLDPKYPDRQWVQRTAKKKLAEMTKPVKVKPRFTKPKLPWKGIATFAVVVVSIAGIALLAKFGQQMLSSSTSTPTQTLVPFSTSTKVPAKTSTPRAVTLVPVTGGYADPTMYDDFDDPAYDGKINSIKWDYGGVGYFSQGKGILTLRVNGTKNEIWISSYKKYSLGTKPIFVEARIMSDPNNADVSTGLDLTSDDVESICSIYAGQGYQKISCWSTSFGVRQQEYSVEISPGAWHILRIELFPDTMTFKYLADGNALGSYTPENKQDFKSSVFRAGFGMNNTGDATEYPVSYVDYVRMGAIEDDPQVFVYDNFDDDSLDGSFDSALWKIAYDGGKIYQENRNLTLYVDNQGQEWLYTGLIARKYSGYKFTHPISFEAKMSLDTGDESGIFMQVQSVDGKFRYGCGIESIETPHVKCFQIEHEGGSKSIFYDRYERSNWHTFRFTLEPAASKIYYYMDGKPVGSFISEYPDEFNNVLYDLYVQGFVYKTGKSVGLVDYVRIGSIDDNFTNREPFFWAVGEWEATDSGDKSHLKMSIKRVSAGQYTFVSVDSSANFCGGGAGKAEFMSNTMSNIAAASPEFVCDSTSQKIQNEYKLTYNRINDQLMDSSGVTWNRKK